MDLRIKNFLIPPHPLTNCEIHKYYQNGPKFNGVYSRGSLPKRIKDGAYVINLDEYASVGACWIALYVEDIEVTYFHIPRVEYVPKEIENIIAHNNIKTKIFRI